MKKSLSPATTATGYDREELWAHEHNQKLIDRLKRSNVLPFRPRNQTSEPSSKTSVRSNMQSDKKAA